MLTLLLFVLPLMVVALMSLTDWQFGAASWNWIGLGNYADLWNDTTFRKSFANTVYYLVVVSVGSIAIGLAVALLIESHDTWRGFYRTAFFMPVASTLIAMAVVWQFLMHPSVGFLNHVLGWFGAEPRNWLKDYDLALPALAARHLADVGPGAGDVPGGPEKHPGRTTPRQPARRHAPSA